MRVGDLLRIPTSCTCSCRKPPNPVTARAAAEHSCEQHTVSTTCNPKLVQTHAATCSTPCSYFSSPAHWVDAISNGLLLVCVALWWCFVRYHAGAWSMQLQYSVSADLQPSANFLRLAGAGGGLRSAWASLRGLEAAVALVAWYYALSGINILLLLARLLRRMDFQPRLGVITRSLRRAMPDLLHFALVAGAVFVGYSMMAFLIFGNAVPQFAGFGTSVNTCFSMMLGDFTDVFAALQQLGGVQVRGRGWEVDARGHSPCGFQDSNLPCSLPIRGLHKSSSHPRSRMPPHFTFHPGRGWSFVLLDLHATGLLGAPELPAGHHC